MEDRRGRKYLVEEREAVPEGPLLLLLFRQS